MPNRIVRESLLDSETISRAGELAEVLFVRLMLVADDYGRFDGRVTVICRACWPIGKESDPKPADVNARLNTLAALGLVIPYETDGKPFIYIPKFKQRTRAMRSKFPDPPVKPPTPARQLTDAPPTDDGAPHVSRARSRSRISESETGVVVRNSDSNAERARPDLESIPATDTPRRSAITSPGPAGPRGGLSPSEFYRNVTGTKPPRKPFEEDDDPLLVEPASPEPPIGPGAGAEA